MGFESEQFDETPYQREVVAALGTEHSALTCTRADIGSVFPEVVRHTERLALQFGCAAYLRKPLDVELFVQVLLDRVKGTV